MKAKLLSVAVVLVALAAAAPRSPTPVAPAASKPGSRVRRPGKQP